MSTLAPAVDREAVIARDPDVILIGAAGSRARGKPSSGTDSRVLQAGKESSHIHPGSFADRPRMAPRILQGVQAVCASLDAARSGPRRLQ